MTVCLRDSLGTFQLYDVKEIQVAGNFTYVTFRDGSEDKFVGAEILSAVE